MNGSLFIGSKGKIAIQHGRAPKVLDAEPSAGEPDTATFSGTHHHQQWIAACKTGSATGSNFAYAGPFTEVVLLGNVAYRAGHEIEYNPRTVSTGSETTDRLLRKDYRQGWHLEG
jgi:hypothetical protein